MNNLLAGSAPGNQENIRNSLLRGTMLDNLQDAGAFGDPGAFLRLFLPNLIGLLFVFGVVAFFFMLIWGAVSWILSGGDKAKIESAKGRITSALVGIVLMLATFAIVKLIEAFFGIDILSIDMGPLVIQ